MVYVSRAVRAGRCRERSHSAGRRGCGLAWRRPFADCRSPTGPYMACHCAGADEMTKHRLCFRGRRLLQAIILKDETSKVRLSVVVTHFVVPNQTSTPATPQRSCHCALGMLMSPARSSAEQAYSCPHALRTCVMRITCQNAEGAVIAVLCMHMRIFWDYL